MNSFALYIHIPYCHHKCPYCDFNTYAVNQVPEVEYCQALAKEFAFQLKSPLWADRKISSIYFGGGTPSILSDRLLSNLIEAFVKYAPDLQELTIEANPEHLTLSSIQTYFNCGVTRLSLGAQSLNDKNLRLLGRTHTANNVRRSLEFCQKVGLENINLDLMFGIPEQTFEQLNEDIANYIDLSCPHISAYNLTVETGTTFHQRQHAGSLVLPDSDLAADMFQLVSNQLQAAGYKHYEISNYAKPNCESQHNLAYWDLHDYLGLGAGAHSYNSLGGNHGVRWCNLASPKAYMRSALADISTQAWREELTDKSAMFEFLFLGLRKLDGVKLTDFKQRFKLDLSDAYQQPLIKLQEQGLVVLDSEILKLTSKGILLADSVFEQFTENAIIDSVTP